MSLCLDRYAADPADPDFHVVPGRGFLQGGTTGGGGALKWLREAVCPKTELRADERAGRRRSPRQARACCSCPTGGRAQPTVETTTQAACFSGSISGNPRASDPRGHGRRGVRASAQPETAGKRRRARRNPPRHGRRRQQPRMDADQGGRHGHAVEVPASDTATTLGAAILAAWARAYTEAFGTPARARSRKAHAYARSGAEAVYDRNTGPTGAVRSALADDDRCRRRKEVTVMKAAVLYGNEDYPLR
jgi:xylulokinase